MGKKKEERKNKEERKKEGKKKNNKIKIFVFDFLDCEEQSLDSGAIFNIRIAKVCHLYEFCISSLFYLGAAPIP